MKHLSEKRFWFVVLARGGVALSFALLAIANPWMPVAKLAKLFAGFAFVDGLLALFGATLFNRQPSGRAWLLATEGAASIAAALLALALPVTGALRLVGGVRAIVAGAAEGVWSARSRVSELVELDGITAIALGALALAWPGPATVALPWLLGLIAFVSGALTVAGALSELRSGAHFGRPAAETP